MLENIAVAVFTENPILYERVEVTVRNLSGRVVRLPCLDRPETLRDFARDSSLIVLLDTSQQRDVCLRWIRRLCEARPDAIAACLEAEFNQEHALEAIRAGAKDLLVGNFTDEEVLSLLKRLAITLERPSLPSTVLAVLGVAGGAGASMLTANLAVEIAQLQSAPVGILGLNSHSSGVELLLDVPPNVTLFDLWQRVGDLDATVIKQAAAIHASGVCLLSSGEWPPEHLPIPGKVVRRVILLMQELFPYVLVDLPRDFPPAAQSALENTETLLLVSQHSVKAAAGAARILQALEVLGYPENRILWVANSVVRPEALTLKELRRVMLNKPFATIPFDPDAVNLAEMQAGCLSTVAPRAAVTKAIQRLAAALCESIGRSDSEDGHHRPRKWRTLFSKKNLVSAGAGR